MAMILSALLRRGAGRGYDTGEAPLRVEGRYWRPKPLEEIVGRANRPDPSTQGVSPDTKAPSNGSPLPLPLQMLRDHWPGMDRAAQIGDEVKVQFHGHNDLGDAMRHAEWNRRMQIELGTLTAFLAGYGHELENLYAAEANDAPIPLGEILMDLHNNSEGRRAARAQEPIDTNRLMRRPPSGWRDDLEQYP